MKNILPIVAISFLSTTCLCPVLASEVEDAQQVKTTEAAKVAESVGQESSKDASEAMQQMGRTTKIMGAAVVDKKGDSVGSISDLMIDPATSQIAYAVVSYGDVMGMGGKLFGMPWNEMVWNREKQNYTIDVDVATLAKAPGFVFDADK